MPQVRKREHKEGYRAVYALLERVCALLIIKDVLGRRREYFKKVQACLLKAIITLANRYPEPAMDTVVWESSKALIRLRDDIRKYHKNPGRQPVVDAFFNLVINKNEVDGYYDFLLGYGFEHLKKDGFTAPDPDRGFPMWRYWSGPLQPDNEIETNPDWLAKRMKAKQGTFGGE